MKFNILAFYLRCMCLHFSCWLQFSWAANRAVLRMLLKTDWTELKILDGSVNLRFSAHPSWLVVAAWCTLMISTVHWTRIIVEQRVTAVLIVQQVIVAAFYLKSRVRRCCQCSSLCVSHNVSVAGVDTLADVRLLSRTQAVVSSP